MGKQKKPRLLHHAMPSVVYVTHEADGDYYLTSEDLDGKDDGDVVYVYELKAKATVDKKSPQLRNVENMK